MLIIMILLITGAWVFGAFCGVAAMLLAANTPGARKRHADAINAEILDHLTASGARVRRRPDPNLVPLS